MGGYIQTYTELFRLSHFLGGSKGHQKSREFEAKPLCNTTHLSIVSPLTGRALDANGNDSIDPEEMRLAAALWVPEDADEEGSIRHIQLYDEKTLRDVTQLLKTVEDNERKSKCVGSYISNGVSDDAKGIFEATRDLGHFFQALGNNTIAVSFYHRAQSQSQNLDVAAAVLATRELANALEADGTTLRDAFADKSQGRTEEALKCFEESRQMAKQGNLAADEKFAANSIKDTLLHLQHKVQQPLPRIINPAVQSEKIGNLGEGIQHLSRALEVLEQSPSEDKTAISDVYARLSDAHRRMNSNTSALKVVMSRNNTN